MSLLEVLVALAVLAIAMAALVRTVSLQAVHLGEAALRTEAQWVAANVLAQTRLAASNGTASALQGQMPMGHRQWRWQLETHATPLPGVQRLRVTVQHPDGSRVVLALDGFTSPP